MLGFRGRKLSVLFYFPLPQWGGREGRRREENKLDFVERGKIIALKWGSWLAAVN